MKGIHSGGGVIAYVVARALKLKRRPTPLALAGAHLPVETALTIANVADKARGPGSGATVWDMAARFKVPATGVSWDMLEQLNHKPVVIVRKANYSGAEFRDNSTGLALFRRCEFSATSSASLAICGRDC